MPGAPLSRVLIAAAAAGAAAAPPLPPGVLLNATFSRGTVTGVLSASASVAYWLGVPFAASTDGANAFAPPAPRAPWAGARNGTAWTAGCVQPHHNADVPPLQSFDCLTVNIYAPPPAAGAPLLPVMVFFNGGAYEEGSAEGPFGMYSGASLAAHGVVVVTANYRLGAYGWAGGLPAINITGNYGLMDMVAALEWVRAEIAAVGGDAQQVTVFGESAGAMSIGILLTTPRAEGLFHRAIMESNVGGFNYPNASHAAVYGAAFCSDPALNCAPGGACSAACLRAAAPAAVMSAWNSATGSAASFVFSGDIAHILDGLLSTGPIVDGSWVLEEPQGALARGDYWARSVPILLGTNTNEGETFIYDGVDFPLPGFLIPAAYYGILGFNETAAKLVDAQPRCASRARTASARRARSNPDSLHPPRPQPTDNSSAFADGRTPLSQMVTDYWFRCASERFLAGAVKNGAAAYAYRFNHLYSNASIFPTFGLPQICSSVVCHASELPFVFHELPSFASFTPDEDALADRMGTYWTNFAKGLAPGAAWPAWDPAARQTLVLNNSESVETTAGLCGFWDGLSDAYFW